MRLVTIAPPTNRTIVAAQDSQGYNPCIGYEDAIPEEARDGNHAIYCGPDELERVSLAPSPLRFKNPNTDMVSLSNHALRKKGNIELVLSSPPRAENEGGDPVFGFTSEGSRLADLFIPRAYALPVTLISLSKEPKKLSPTPASKLQPVNKFPAVLSPFSAHPEPVEGRSALRRRRNQFGVAQQICNTSGVGCCTIAADGSFECYPQSDNETTLCIQVVNILTGAVSECVNEDPNRNVLWMRKKPLDNTPGPVFPGDQSEIGLIYTLTDGNIVPVSEEAGVFQVVGDWRSEYREIPAPEAREIAYDGAVLGLRKPVTGIDNHEVVIVGDVITEASIRAEGVLKEIPFTQEYTVLKVATNGKLMFGRERETDDPTTNEKIHDALFETPLDNLDALGLPVDDGIEFLSAAFFEGDDIHHNRTITFDVDDQGFALVVYEDTDGNVKLRRSDGITHDLDVETTLGPVAGFDIKDLQVYHDNTSSSVKGKALLLDAQGNRVGVVEFNRYGASINVNIPPGAWRFLGAGKNPQSFVLNPQKTKAYVVNMGDETITELDLKLPSGTPRAVPVIARTINMRDYIPGKDLEITPNQVTYRASEAGQFLVVGAEDLKSSMVILLATQARREAAQPAVLRPEVFNILKPSEKAKTPSGKKQITLPGLDKTWITPKNSSSKESSSKSTGSATKDGASKDAANGSKSTKPSLVVPQQKNIYYDMPPKTGP